MEYAKAANARRVEVFGYRASVRLSGGTTLSEYPWIAEHRAEIMADTLREIGVSAPIVAKWSQQPELGSGQNAFQERRLTIVVNPD
jgi:hypothetical protein